MSFHYSINSNDKLEPGIRRSRAYPTIYPITDPHTRALRELSLLLFT